MQPTPTPTAATPNPAPPDVTEAVKTLMREYTEVDGILIAFNNYIDHEKHKTEEIYSGLYEGLCKEFKDCTPESLEFGVRHIVHIAADHPNEVTMDILINIVDKLVATNVVTARLACEALLEEEKLTFKNQKFWNSTFILVRKIVGGVDYKGVREVMKICLDKIANFPANVPAPLLPQLNAVIRVLLHIFDRNACLLPAYFIVNELLKTYPENRNFPHWCVSRLLSEFTDSFRPTAQIVSVIGRSRMLPIVEHSGHASYLIHSWKLDPNNLRFVLKGSLPYDKELLMPQERLLRYILEQPYSRDMACAILGLQKQHKVRCISLEERLVELVVLAMEKTEAEMNQAGDSQSGFEEISGATLWLWQHLSTQLIFFVLFQFANFPHIVLGVHDKLAEVKLFKGRDFLMWILLQFISGSIQKNPLSDFLPVLRLYDLLYPEKDPLSMPDMSKPYCTSQMSPTCIWIHILKKAQTDNVPLPRPLPATLRKHFDYLQMLVQPGSSLPQLKMNDFRIALLCNAFSTNQEHFSRPMAALVEAIHGTAGSNVPQNPVAPLSVQILDSLTVHTKMSLIHNIVTHILKIAQSKSGQTLAPALIETYARLLVYMEIESLGIKGFISQLLPAVYKSQAWGILHTLLEMFCYRLHHIQPHYRVQLLSHLHSLAANAHTNLAQLHLCVEMTALRLITGFNSADVHSQLSRIISESKTLVSTESEELNRALVLTIARAIHIIGADCVTGSGTWFRDVLSSIMTNTPHNWSSHTLQYFPPVLAEYFQQNQVPKENKQQLKSMVEEEYRNWSTNEHELIEHFTIQGSPPLFLCILWKMIIDSDRIQPVAFKILERIGPKALSNHLRKFCDYIVFEFANAGGGQFVSKYADAITDLIWKYNVVPFDRLLLCLALRTNEGNEGQVCFFIIHMLMVKPVEFRSRVLEFVKENSPEHWKQSNWHEKHKSFNGKFPEVFLFEDQTQNQLPVYFGNVCLRFLPVFDIVIHRFLEVNVVGKSLEMILEHLGCLYKFHDRPITYLYNTLHYYETRLRDKAVLKKKLVTSILGPLRDPKQSNWALSDQYSNYLLTGGDDTNWTPEVDYYAGLISRLVDVIEGKRRYFTGVDWRYNENSNPASHVLYSTCVEIMALPVMPSVVGACILDVVMKGRAMMDPAESSIADILSWYSATGLILISLPSPYWLVLHEKIQSTVESLSQWNRKYSPLVLFNFKAVHNGYLYSEYASLLALTHSVWHHLGAGHVHNVISLITEKLPPYVKTEIQLLYICHLVGPFLQRFNAEKSAMVCQVTVALYRLLEQIDKLVPQDQPIEYMDVFCDLLYHIKYMFTGDVVKNEVEAKIRNLRPALQRRLRFITHLNIEDISSNISTTNSSSGGGTNSNTSTNPQMPANLQSILGL